MCACSLKDFAAQRPLAALVPAEEMGSIRVELQAEADAAAAAAAAQPAADVKPAEGDTAMADAVPGADAAAAAAIAGDVKPELAAAAGTDAEMTPAEAAVPAPLADGVKAETAPLDGAAPDAVKAENGPVAAAAAAAPAPVTDEDVKARWLASLTGLHEVGCPAVLLCGQAAAVDMCISSPAMSLLCTVQ